MTAGLRSVEITMPQLGETVAEGTLTRWLKQVGDQVTEGEPLFEVSTDKVDTEVPAAVSGRLAEILVPVDATVPVGARLAFVELGNVVSASSGPRGASAQPAQPAPPEPAEPHRPRHYASPRARRLLREHGMDLTAVHGSGPDGRVIGADVAKVVGSQERASREAGTVVREFGFVAIDVDFYAIDLVRAEFDYLPFVAYAAVNAIRAFPQVNTGTAIHLGVDGAVIADAGDLRLAALAASLARAPSAEVPTPTFRLRNSGLYGTRFSRMPLPAGATCMLALDAVRPAPVAIPTVDGAALAVHPVGWVSFTFDPAFVDAATAARFLSRTRDILEGAPTPLW